MTMQHIDWISWILKIVRVWRSPSPEDFSEELSPRSHGLHRHLLLVGLMMLTLGYGSVAQAEALVGGADEILATHSNPVSLDAGNGDRLAVPSSAAEVPVGAADRSWDHLPPPDQSAAEQSAADQPTVDQPAVDQPAVDQPTVDQPAVDQPATLPISTQAIPEAAPVAVGLLQTIKLQTTKTEVAAKPVELKFALPQPSFQFQTANPKVLPNAIPEADQGVDPGVDTASLANLFVGNSDSLVAKAVGSAEGTRTPEGDRNPAYFGHVDPGNKAWNLGSFSYQHEAATPEDADVKQLNRLQDQAGIMQAKAQARGISLTLEEALNGIDLANQAPKAVLDQDGYIDWLAKAHQNGLSGDDAVLWARTQSFFDPRLQRWNAPGLGNTQERITLDQERRMQAIDRAIAVHEQPVVQPVIQPVAQPTAQPVAQPSTQSKPFQPVSPQASHKISEDVGIARLFAEQTFSHFGRSGSTSASEPTATLPEAPGIAALFELDLPKS